MRAVALPCPGTAQAQPQLTCNLPGRRVGENNGIRFPREFALLIKQMLYFDR